MLLFEFFPAFVAIAGLIVAVVLFAVNRRAQASPTDDERPRPPSRPPVSAEKAAAEHGASPRRPSMAP